MTTVTFAEIQNTLATKSGRWVARQTPISQLSEAARKHLLGAVPSAAVQAYMAAPHAAVVPGAPALSFDQLVDWRARNGGNFISGIRNQGGCGACVSFACCALVESMSRIEHGVWEDLSEADSHFCSSHGANCDG